MLVATPGGHLTQLMALSERMGIDSTSALWVTHRTAQSESLLAGRDVIWADYASPRDARRMFAHARLAASVLKSNRVSMVVSTGASLAPPFMAAARRVRVPCHYVESATRTTSPSLSGRLASIIPGVRLYTQNESWSSRRWAYSGSVIDGFAPVQRPGSAALGNVLVTVGSARDFKFASMIRAAAAAIPSSSSVIWQIGDNDATGLRGQVVKDMSSTEMKSALATADCVISHAGTGSVISCLEAGILPVVVPRSADRGEHIDGHQRQIAAMLRQRGLALVREPDQLVVEDLLSAAGLTVKKITSANFRLRP